MFTVEERQELRQDLLARASRDSRITGAAITGSGAAQTEDEWSDIDLAFGVKDDANLAEVLAEWTGTMYGQWKAVHHTDVRAGAWIYRVFLLESTLQVDLAFTPASEFRAIAPTFRLVFGEAREARYPQPPEVGDLIAWAWLYALHARSAIARGKLWQAEYMISAMRNQGLALACLRHRLATVHARGVDGLPANVLAPFEAALVGKLERPELVRAFGSLASALLVEIEAAGAAVAERLRGPLLEIANVTSTQR